MEWERGLFTRKIPIQTGMINKVIYLPPFPSFTPSSRRIISISQSPVIDARVMLLRCPYKNVRRDRYKSVHLIYATLLHESMGVHIHEHEGGNTIFFNPTQKSTMKLANGIPLPRFHVSSASASMVPRPMVNTATMGCSLKFRAFQVDRWVHII